MRGVRAVVDNGNAWGFDTAKIVGSQDTVTLEDGQRVFARVDRLVGRPSCEPQGPGWWQEDDQRLDARMVEVTLDFNPSRLLHPNPKDGSLPTTLLRDLLRDLPNSMFRGLGLQRVNLLHPDVRLVKIDLARDFTIGKVLAPEVFAEIRRTPWRYRPTLKLYNKAGEPDNTLEVTRDAYAMKLYDQKLLHGSDFPTDLRCEMNVRRTDYPGSWAIASPATWVPGTLTNIFERCFTRSVPFGASTHVGRLDLDQGRLICH